MLRCDVFVEKGLQSSQRTVPPTAVFGTVVGVLYALEPDIAVVNSVVAMVVAVAAVLVVPVLAAVVDIFVLGCMVAANNVVAAADAMAAVVPLHKESAVAALDCSVALFGLALAPVNGKSINKIRYCKHYIQFCISNREY